jgi:hypothetical protein
MKNGFNILNPLKIRMIELSNEKDKSIQFTKRLDTESINVIHRLYKNTFKQLAKVEREERECNEMADVATEKLKVYQEIALNCIKLNILNLEQIAQHTMLPLKQVKELKLEYERQKHSGFVWMVFKTGVSYQIPNSYPILTRSTKEEALQAISKLPKQFYHLYQIPIEGNFEFGNLYHEQIDTTKR